MSLVTDVLSSAGKMDKEDLNNRVTKLTKRVEEIKLDVQDALKLHFAEISPYFAVTDLNKKLNHAQKEVKNLINKMEKEIKPEIQSAVTDFQDLSDQLRDAITIAAVVENLVKIHENLEAADESLIQKNYFVSAQNLQNAQEILQEILNFDQSVKIVELLKIEMISRKEKLLYDLREIWDRSVIWDIEDGRTKLSVVEENAVERMSLIKALYFMNKLKGFIESFGKKLMQHVLKMIFSFDVGVEDSNNSVTVAVINEDRPEPVKVFLNLKTVFSFLCDLFSDISLTGDDDDKQSELVIMNMLGRVIGEEFCNCLIRDCLDVALPSRTKDLESYSNVIEMTTDLQNMLINLGFLSKDLSSTLEYVQNIDTLFANKMCQEFLVRARNLLKKELHNTIVVTPDTTPLYQLVELDKTITEQTDEKILMPQKGLNNENFKFPKCEISVFTKEILDLIHEVLQEATKSNQICAIKLFYIARNICELYCNVVPVYHQDRISEIPQQSAIYHNNCMFLAHHLLTVGHYYQSKLPVPLSTCSITFVDLISLLRTLAKDSFLSQMRKQKQQLLQYLQDNSIFLNISADENLLPKAEQAVRKCLCQLQFLSRAWSDTLPQSVYCRAIGTLLNTCLEEIILRIKCLEDITVPCATRLISIFSFIISETPQLFKTQDKEEMVVVNHYVRKWDKFQKLQWMLGASMREIVDLWAGGKGVLAAEFSADEVKELIRALFQNTDRRAAALAKIR
ncbi:centromere/kinetochore protein zw10 homolog [Centruroides sculpturatus]|uniref:centromere/kinetochore protein zw10 homolog n=1 Tax=Centruroides sculpturatus TaxID=218467 RepID=UPI000C6D2BA4|nr:centromere/kinetochore protein zw10 homolog [Centruroides sculpturatus]